MNAIRWPTASRKRQVVAGAVVVALIPILAFAWWLGSPLFLNKTVNEEFPLTVGAVLPPDTSRAEAESIMDEASKLDSESVEPMTPEMADAQTVALAKGQFRDEDRFHKGSGDATVYRLADGSHVLRLEELSVTNGPDLHVLLLVDPEGKDKDLGYVDLGELKGNRGNQNYEIPEEVDPAMYQSVMIYCQPFHVIFSTAPLSDL
ncbi:DM13 domain-containing protein [bacterium]|nr:DM13 domain-containing protein [bacterium]